MNNLQKQQFISWLNDPSHNVAGMGSKAAKLAQLMLQGIPVPHGFCVTVEGCDMAFRHHESGIDKKPLSFPPIVSDDIHAAYQSLIEKDSLPKAVAVRSSAIAEDLNNRSYAGQYESYLNIMDEEHLILAIQNVWESALTKRIEVYRQYHALQDAPNGVAVLIQRMVPAILAGVLFTSDPSNDSSKNMVIEGVEGTADEFVSGRITPGRFVYHLPTSNLECIHLASLSECYTKSRFWEPLIKLAINIEKILGPGQDIEWAFDGASFWILQSRPITITCRPPNMSHLTRANIGEVMPGVLTPLTLSVFIKTLSALETEDQDVKPSDEIEFINGRAYIKVQGLWNSYSNIVGVNPAIVLSEGIGVQIDGMERQLVLDSQKVGIIAKFIKTAYVWLELLTCAWAYPRLSKKLKMCSNLQSKKNKDSSHNEIIAVEIWSELTETVELTSLLFKIHMQSTFIALCAHALLRDRLERFINRSAVDQIMSLAVPFHQDMNVYQDSIHRLAQRALNIPGVADVIRNNSAGSLVSLLSQNGNAKIFLQEIRDAAERLGDRAIQEFELSSPRWSEDPEPFLSAIKSIIEGTEKKYFKAALGEIKSQTRIDQVLKKVPIINRLWINRIYRTLRQYSGMREQTKAALMKSFGECRRTSLTIANILKQKGIIAENSDIFFLTLDEIHDIFFMEKAVGDIPSFVKKRKQEYERDINTHQISNNKRLNESRMIMKGTPVSGGLVTGTARLIYNPYQAFIKEGEILVAEHIDPGWMPLFMLAGGIVTEIGGMLSHMATLAREAQKPAIFSVPEVTRRIRDGEKITVDGFTGKVYINSNSESE
jgi:rifampicin phosphotransferase